MKWKCRGIASLRGMNAVNDKAIHNLVESKYSNGIFQEMQHYRLPQPLTRLRNDKSRGGMPDSIQNLAMTKVGWCATILYRISQLQKVRITSVRQHFTTKVESQHLKLQAIPRFHSQPCKRYHNTHSLVATFL